MADHWKSIANLLGAPGVDLPEDENEQSEKPQDASAAEQSIDSTIDDGADEEASPGGDEVPEVVNALDARESGTPDEVRQEDLKAKSRKKTRRESRPPAGADMSVRFSEKETTEPEEEESDPVEEAKSSDETVEVISAVVAKSQSKTSQQSASAKKKTKKKVKSSWGKIADLFGVGGDDAEELDEEDVIESSDVIDDASGASADAVDVIAAEVGEVVEKRSAPQEDSDRGSRGEGRRSRRGDRKRPPRGDRKRDAEAGSIQAESKSASLEEGPALSEEQITDDMLSFKSKPKQEPSLSIFDEDSTDEDNPALKEMFGEASGDYEDSWSSEAKVIDDVSWETEDSDDVLDSETEDAEQPVSRGRRGSSRSDREVTDEGGETKSERGGRRRRGRRGRGRGRDVQSEDRDDEVAEDEISKSDPWDKASVESSTEQWDEPESFGADDEDVEVERRSSRRRRRGRRRGGEEISVDKDGSNDVEARSSEPVELDDEADEEWSSQERSPRVRSEGGSRRSNRDSEQGGRDDDRGGATRRRRARPESIDTDEGGRSRVRAPADDSEDDEDTPKHRNIPAWSDALETLVTANIQNHKRNESRGRGGRSRGRR
jgi:ribonuclease E